MNQNTASKKIIDWLYDFSNRRINYRLMEERRTVPPHVILEFGNQGIFGLQVPKKYGGLGLNNVEALKIYEYLGTMNITLAAFVGQNSSLGIRPIVDFASEAVKEKYLPDLAQGRKLASYALTEPHAGSFPNNMRGTIKSIGGQQYLLNAEKIYIGNIGWSSLITIFAKQITESGKPGGFTCCLIETDKKGVEIGAEHLTMGLRAAVQNKLVLQDVILEEAELLGAPGQSYKISHKAMQMSRMVIGAISVGGMKRSLFLMHRYAQRRAIATGKMIDHPEVIQHLNEVAHKIAAVDALVRFLGQRLDQEMKIPDEAFMVVKIMGSEFLWQTTDRFVQILGGRGFMENNVAASFLRDARVLRVFEGPTETLNYFIGYLFKQMQVVQFLAKELQEIELVEELHIIYKKLKGKTETLTHFDQAAKKSWLHCQMGEILSWAFLLAVVKEETKKSKDTNIHLTLKWVQNQFEKTVEQHTQSAPSASFISKEQLNQIISSFPKMDLEQSLQDEVKQMDSYLSNAYEESFEKEIQELILQK